MVDRLQTPGRLVVVDLDGTLIKGNSLNEYVKLGIKQLRRRHQYRELSWVVSSVLIRKLRLSSHWYIKKSIANYIGYDDELYAAMRERLLQMLDTNVLGLLEHYRSQGCRILLATASFDFIAAALPGYDYVATKLDNNSYSLTECRGTVKAQAVNAYASKLGIDPRHGLQAVITDHHDDLPLLRMPFAERYIVRPSTMTRNIITAAGIPVKYID